MIGATFLSRAERGQAQRLLMLAIFVGILAGIIAIPNVDSVIAYAAVLLASTASIFMWLRLGAPGVPILPIVSCVYMLYFGVPVLAGNVGNFKPPDILTACLTAALFLVVASFVCFQIMRHRIKRTENRAIRAGLKLGSGTLFETFLAASLLFGLIFQMFVMQGLAFRLGGFFGVARAIALSATSAGSFLLGAAIGSGDLSRGKRPPFYFVLGANVLLQMTGLYLVQAVTFVAAALFGYIIGAKRIPWGTLVAVGLVLGLLNLGKGDMRQKYWTGLSQDTGVSVFDTPSFFAEWINDSINNLLLEQRFGVAQQSIVNRASLLTQLVTVQQATPEKTPYLDGATYALFPLMLVPRFLSPDKLSSQIVSHVLSVRYGYMTAAQTSFTTVGWGIVAEAFANFGYGGVIAAAVAFGLLVGWLSSLSIGTAPLSLANLISITGLVTSLNVEADFADLLITMWQAVVAVIVFYHLLRLFAVPGPRTVQPVSVAPA